MLSQSHKVTESRSHTSYMQNKKLISFFLLIDILSMYDRQVAKFLSPITIHLRERCLQPFVIMQWFASSINVSTEKKNISNIINWDDQWPWQINFIFKHIEIAKLMSISHMKMILFSVHCQWIPKMY